MQTYPLPGQSIAVDLTYILNPSQGNKENNNSVNMNGLEESVDLSAYVNIGMFFVWILILANGCLCYVLIRLLLQAKLENMAALQGRVIEYLLMKMISTAT